MGSLSCRVRGGSWRGPNHGRREREEGPEGPESNGEHGRGWLRRLSARNCLLLPAAPTVLRLARLPAEETYTSLLLVSLSFSPSPFFFSSFVSSGARFSVSLFRIAFPISFFFFLHRSPRSRCPREPFLVSWSPSLPGGDVPRSLCFSELFLLSLRFVHLGSLSSPGLATATMAASAFRNDADPGMEFGWISSRLNTLPRGAIKEIKDVTTRNLFGLIWTGFFRRIFRAPVQHRILCHLLGWTVFYVEANGAFRWTPRFERCLFFGLLVVEFSEFLDWFEETILGYESNDSI